MGAGSQPEVGLGLKHGLRKAMGLGLRVGQELGPEKQWGLFSLDLEWWEGG